MVGYEVMVDGKWSQRFSGIMRIQDQVLRQIYFLAFMMI